MLYRLTRIAALFGAASAAAISAPLSAQNVTMDQSRSARLPFVEVSPYAGYMIFGSLFKGPLGTSLSLGNQPIYGAQLGVALTPNVSLVGNVAHAGGNLQVGVPFLGGLPIASSSVWLYGGDLQLSLPLPQRGLMPITPFVQAGAGAFHYNIGNSLIKTNATNFAFDAGAGLDVGLSKNVGLRLMAKDYIGKFDFKDATMLDLQSQTANNWAFSAGLKLAF
jgi:hypothetical protein